MIENPMISFPLLILFLPLLSFLILILLFLDGHRWDQPDGYTKFSAARLIELIKPELIIPNTLGFYANHSLVLINNGGASFDEVMNLINQIQSKIYEQFKIQLVIEPEIIGS